MEKIIIATRASQLALWQAEHIQARITTQYPAIKTRLLTVQTTGDKILDVPLAKVGGKGLFVKEIEEALLDGRADIAVHSMKDMPVTLPEGLEAGIIPRRGNRTDTLVSVRYPDLTALPEGACVGTSSLRRQALLKILRPDLTIQTLRGNVNTRLQKLFNGQYDAIIMASAAIERLQLEAPYCCTLAPPDFLPAVAQGALGIEYRTDSAIPRLLNFLHDTITGLEVQAERGFLTGLDGGCQVPVAAHATVQGDTVHLTGCVANPDGSHAIRQEQTGLAHDAFALGMRLADKVLKAGAREILARLYARQ